MSLFDESNPTTTTKEYVEPKPPTWLVAVAVAALVVALGGLVWSLGLQNHLSDAETKLAAANQQNATLTQKIEDTNERLKAQGAALAQSVGLTQKQLEDKSDELVTAQKVAQAQTAKLARAEAATAQQVGAVQTDVSTVKTDVGGGEDGCCQHPGRSRGDQEPADASDGRCGRDERSDRDQP